MDYHSSTQARAWMYNEASLAACKQRAVGAAPKDVAILSSTDEKGTNKITDGVRKFASGFHQRFEASSESFISIPFSESISTGDQELLVQFHAHQIQTLVGPTAIMRDLRTSETVLSTAVTFFRRFYLSNSILQVHPRGVAVACAFLAAKVEEERVQIELLSHATSVIQARVYNTPDCCRELRALTIYEIEEAERQLMYGLDYMFRCYHTSSALQNLIPDFCAFQSRKSNAENDTCDDRRFIRKALEVARRALVFSDAPFLYSPCHTAFAITAMVSRSITDEGKMGNDIQAFLVKAFPNKTKEELLSFTRSAHEIIDFLMNCSPMDLRPAKNGRAKEIVETRAEELRRVLGIAAKFRKTCPPSERQLKRMRYEPDFTPPSHQQNQARKYVKVTPMGRRGSYHSCESDDAGANQAEQWRV